MQRYIIALLFLCLHSMARGQTDDGPLYYWFDSEQGSPYSDSLSNGQWRQTIDVSQLRVGLHTFYVIATDGKGRASTPVMRQFYKIDKSGEGEQFRCLCYVDGELFSQKEVSSEGGLISLGLDASTLTEGLHRIQLQVLTESGTVSGVYNGFFMRVATQQELGQLTCLCYVDGEPFYQEKISTEGGLVSLDLDASMLSEGLHHIQLQVLTESGTVSGVYNGFFMRVATQQELGQLTCLCYVDGELFYQEKVSVEGGLLNLNLDANELTEGLHRIQLQVITESGVLSGAYNGFFMRVTTQQELGQFNCLFYVDGEPFYQGKISTEGGLLSLNLDANELTEGLHRIQLYVITESGIVSGVYNGFFIRVATTEELSEYYCMYTLDDDTVGRKASKIGHDGTFHFDLDMSELSDGLHHISYFLSSEKGASSSPQTRFFIKVPEGGNAISLYEYWLNDGMEQKKTVNLPTIQNPLKLISLLPVGQQPLRSSLFYFEVKDGQPMMYGKNDFHIRFYDGAGRFTDATEQYIDYNVSQKVEDVNELELSQVFAKPADNDVIWYKFDALRGDTVTFCLSQAATIQVYSPEGEEIYKAQGSTSVAKGGCHTWSDGTYYVAVHDVMGSKPSTTLEYSHLSKYDVVRQDVRLVGNGGCSTITFDGNGFKDLYAVDLYNAQGDSIHHVYIGHESDATTSVTFDFTDAVIGTYHAKFCYTEGDKVFKNLVTVEEAKGIELSTTVTFPSTFLRGTSTTYTIKIANLGNMTAYAVPISMNISCRTINGITHLNLEGLNLKSLYEYYDEAGLISGEEDEVLYTLSENIGEDHYFLKVKGYDEEINDSIIVRSNIFFANISPNSTKQILLTLMASENVEAYFGVPKEWDASFSQEHSYSRSEHKANWYCCHHEQIECGATVLSLTLDGISFGLALATGGTSLALEAVSCVSSATSTVSSFASQFICDHKKLWSWSTLGNTVSAVGTLASCGAFKKIELATEAVSALANQYVVPSTLVNCGNSGKKKPGCTNPNGGSSNMRNSCEPNDMLGYVAESGSHAIKDGLTDVWYTIQFENDTVFATAPAHDIYLTDTLDVNLFDLSTYRPTKITIGEKSMELTGERNFISTLDMRPEINAIAQIEGTIDDKTGIVRWHISSLDPMTMEPTDDVMQGVLPVNFDGRGLGEASFDISLRPNLPHDTEIPNRSGNVFDYNETVMTPTWTNIIDRIAPESRVVDVNLLNDSTATVSINATDDGSGLWRYDVYVQYGTGSAWWKAAENVPIDSLAHVKVYEGMDQGFYVVATDMAGNVEQKQAVREFSMRFNTVNGDVNGDGTVDTQDAIKVIQHYLKKNPADFNVNAADVNGDGVVDTQDAIKIIRIYLKKE